MKNQALVEFIMLRYLYIRYAACFILLMVFPIYLVGNTTNVREILNTIPQNEKEILNQLFHNLFNRNNFSYTLFGDKPISLAAYFTTSLDCDGRPTDRNVRFWNKWAVWKKYAHAFPITKYLLIEMFEDRTGSREIYFINKKCFIEKVNDNLSLFRKKLGENITGDLLLKNIEDNPRFLSLFNNNQLLLGILLGYGEHNSYLFDKRNLLSPFIYKKELPEVPVKIPDPSNGFSSLQEEFNSYFSMLTLFGDPGYSPLVIHSVHFVAEKKHPETIALQQKYRKMREDISKIYAKGDFLEITLSKLTEE